MSIEPLPEPTDTVHEMRNGAECHYFNKVDGFWVCDCGERRDSAGRQI